MKRALSVLVFLISNNLFAQDVVPYTQQEVIYGRKDGTALTMVILKPEKKNGKAIISLISGGYKSSYNWISLSYSFPQQPNYLKWAFPYLNEGYTVFLTIHSAAPRYAIPSMLKDIQRAIQYVRYNAVTYNIDPNYISITGHSSGGNLALLAGLSNDIKDPKSKDSISKISSKVQAIIALCPPTNFLKQDAGTSTQKSALGGAFNYTKIDTSTNVYVPVENSAERRIIDSLMSPLQIITKDAPPVYLIFGGNDKWVQIKSSQPFIDKYKSMGLECSFVVKEGEEHDLKGLSKDDFKNIFTWLEKTLKN
jgi:acetyl esterase/lipase